MKDFGTSWPLVLGLRHKVELYMLRKVEVKVLIIQFCLTLCNLMDYSLPGSSVHEILQVRILGRLPFPTPGNVPDPGTEPGSHSLQVDSLPSERPGKSTH